MLLQESSGVILQRGTFFKQLWKSAGRAFSFDIRRAETSPFVVKGTQRQWSVRKEDGGRIEVTGSLKSDRVREPEKQKGQRAASLTEFVGIVRRKFVVP